MGKLLKNDWQKRFMIGFQFQKDYSTNTVEMKNAKWNQGDQQEMGALEIINRRHEKPEIK